MEPVVRYATREDLPRVNELRQQVSDLHAAGRPDIFRPGFCEALQQHVYQLFDAPEFDVLVACVAKRSAALPPCSMWTGRSLRICAPAASTTLKNSVWTMASGGTAWGRPCSGSARQKPNAGALTGWSLTSGHLMKTRRNSTKQWDFRPIAAISSCRSTARREAKRQTEKQKRRGTMPHGMIPRLFVHRGDSQVGLADRRRRMGVSGFSSG